RLYQLFNHGGAIEELDKTLLVVVESDNHKVGLLVDDLLAQQQVVIKSLEANYQKVNGISGATILGDGRVSLIVDISGLIKLSG
ncbi:chemotaxis protein CheA, partial [Pseudoalteromonas sp. S3178]